MKSILSNKIILIILAVLVVGGGVFMLTRDSDDSSSNSSSSSSANSSSSSDSSSSSQTSSNKKSDPCTLFDKADFASIWGVTMSDKQEKSKELNNPTFKENNCQLDEAHPDTVAGIAGSYVFDIKVSTFESAEAAKSRFESDKASIKNFSSRAPAELESETKVGDGTYFNVASSGEAVIKSSTYIVVLKGNEIIDVSATRLDGVDQTTNRANLIKLTQTKL